MTPRALALAVLSYAFRWVDWAWGRFCDLNILSDNDLRDIERLGRKERIAMVKKLWWDCKPRFIVLAALAGLAGVYP